TKKKNIKELLEHVRLINMDTYHFLRQLIFYF
ncbi:unnamed protein product, partial [marine sediment metagenome]